MNEPPSNTTTISDESCPAISRSITTVASALLLGSGSVVALLALTFRPLAPTDLVQSDWFQVLLLTCGWLVAAVLLRECVSQNPVAQSVRIASGILMSISLIVWSGTLPVAIAVAFPAIAVLVASTAGRSLGWQLIAPTTRAVIDNPPRSITPDNLLNQRVPESDISQDYNVQPEATPVLTTGHIDSRCAAESLPDENSDPENGEADVWRGVQQEFARDDTLVQNLSRWESIDGKQTIVNNVRCRLSADGSATVHVPLWPFLGSDPEVYCSIADDSPGDVAVIQARPNGIVVQVKTPASGESIRDSLVIEIVAISRACQKSAPAA